jgi:hypothetical protein
MKSCTHHEKYSDTCIERSGDRFQEQDISSGSVYSAVRIHFPKSGGQGWHRSG